MKAYLSIQCTASDNTTGTFLSGADGKLISPVARDCVELFAWAKANGWTQAPRDSSYPVGVYQKEEI